MRKALDYYTEMEKALERKKQNRAQSENTAKSKETTVGAQSTMGSHTDAGPEASKPDTQWTKDWIVTFNYLNQDCTFTLLFTGH